MPEYIEICEVIEIDLTQDNEAPDRGLETPDLSGTVNVILSMTASEFIQMLSALNQGAEILYPDKSHEITDWLVQGAIDGE